MNIEDDIRQLVAQSVNASIRALLSRIERLEREPLPESGREEEWIREFEIWYNSPRSYIPSCLEAFKEGWMARGKLEALQFHPSGCCTQQK